MTSWKDQVKVSLGAADTQAPAALNESNEMALLLETAADAFDLRTDDFARGKGATCRDIAAKLRRFGSFASPKQADFAAKLVAWSRPRPGAPVVEALMVPRLFDVMQRHADLRADPLKLSRKKQDSLVWIIWHDKCVGKIERATVTLFKSKFADPADQARVEAMLREFDAAPLATA